MPTPRMVRGFSSSVPNFQMRRTALRTSGVARGTTLHKTAPLIFLVPDKFFDERNGVAVKP